MKNIALGVHLQGLNRQQSLSPVVTEFIRRVEADSGIVEAATCLNIALKELN